MKNYRVQMGMRVATMIAVIGMSALAATAAEKLTLVVPFDFNAGATEFKAGEYRVSLDAPSAGSVTIEAAKGRSSAIVLSHAMPAGTTLEAPTVVFNVYGEKCFLTRILTGDGNGRELPQNTTQTEVARGTDTSKVATLKVAILPDLADIQLGR